MEKRWVRELDEIPQCTHEWMTPELHRSSPNQVRWSDTNTHTHQCMPGHINTCTQTHTQTHSHTHTQTHPQTHSTNTFTNAYKNPKASTSTKER